MDRTGPAFPNGPDEGMSYREWLIGKIASAAGPPSNTVDPAVHARRIIAAADAILAELADEPKAGK